MVSRSIMKPEKEPFIVEFKNRRRQSTQQNSIWAAIDLKAASNQVAANEMASMIDASTDEPPSDATLPGTQQISAPDRIIDQFRDRPAVHIETALRLEAGDIAPCSLPRAHPIEPDACVADLAVALG